MPYRNKLGEFDLCAICKHNGDEQECEGCEIPMACLNNFEAVEHLVAILQEMRPVAVGKNPGSPR
jgi:hypothetical protein